MTVGQRINLKRKLKGVSRAELAEKANIPIDTLNAWIYRDVHPDVLAVAKVADVLECTLDELVGRTVAK